MIIIQSMPWSIVSYVIRDRNDNKLVFDTLDKAVLENPNAHPLFHSDRGFQYTSRTFHKKLLDAGMTQSMSRVGRCIDNCPMEGFWGMLKRECYYGHLANMSIFFLPRNGNTFLDNKSGAFCKAPLLFIEKTTSYACGRKEP